MDAENSKTRLDFMIARKKEGHKQRKQKHQSKFHAAFQKAIRKQNDCLLDALIEDSESLAADNDDGTDATFMSIT